MALRTQPDTYSQQALTLELRAAAICNRITADGVPFDTVAAAALREKWTARRSALEAQLQQQFPGNLCTDGAAGFGAGIGDPPTDSGSGSSNGGTSSCMCSASDGSSTFTPGRIALGLRSRQGGAAPAAIRG